MLGVKKPANQNEYVGQSGRGDKLVDQHFPKQDGENVLIQARGGGHATDASVRRAVADVMSAVSGQPRVADVKSPYAKGNGSQVSKDGRSVLVTFNVKGDDVATGKAIDPIEAAVKDAGAREPGRVGRPVRRRQREQGADEVLPGRLQEGRDALAADHADHPRARVRRPGGGRHPAAAGPDRRGRDARPDRDPEPDRPDGRHDQLDRAARRPGRRRRLHALLPAPRARGASARRRQARGGPHRRRDLRARRAGVGLHGDGRDGRHVPGRRPHVHRAGRRLDHGRRRRDDRLGHASCPPSWRGSATASTRAASRSCTRRCTARAARAARGTPCWAPSCAARPWPRAWPWPSSSAWRSRPSRCTPR